MDGLSILSTTVNRSTSRTNERAAPKKPSNDWRRRFRPDDFTQEWHLHKHQRSHPVLQQIPFRQVI